MSSTVTDPLPAPSQHVPGLHLFTLGRPAERVFQTVSTCSTPAPERYEHWTSTQIRNLSVDPPTSTQRHNFDASVTSLATLTKEMHYSQSDGFSGVRTRRAIRTDPSDEVCLLYMLEGQLIGRLENEDVVVPAGGFYLYDARLVQRLAISRHRLIQVDLPRGALESALGGPLPTFTTLYQALNTCRLTPLLRSHLAHFPEIAPRLQPADQQRMLDLTESLAMSVLQSAIVGQPAGIDNDQALLQAAQSYIAHNLDSPDLSPTAIAAGIGCSRATLYRVFKRHNLKVAAHVRELRLQRLFQLLQNTTEHRPIAVLAQRCGLYDAPNVNQMFRRRFGVSPSDIRAARP